MVGTPAPRALPDSGVRPPRVEIVQHSIVDRILDLAHELEAVARAVRRSTRGPDVLELVEELVLAAVAHAEVERPRRRGAMKEGLESQGVDEPRLEDRVDVRARGDRFPRPVGDIRPKRADGPTPILSAGSRSAICDAIGCVFGSNSLTRDSTSRSSSSVKISFATVLLSVLAGSGRLSSEPCSPGVTLARLLGWVADVEAAAEPAGIGMQPLAQPHRGLPRCALGLLLGRVAALAFAALAPQPSLAHR
jgi:hypothetical protein